MGYLQEKKKALMNSVVSGGLPSEYQEVEWIKNTSDGRYGSYLEINTYIQETDYVEFVCSEASGSRDLLLCQQPFGNPTYSRFGMGGDILNRFGLFYSNISSNGLYFDALYDGGKHTWKYENKVFSIEDLNIIKDCSGYTYEVSSTQKIRLFHTYSTSISGTIYSYIQKRNGQTIIELVPCYRKLDEKIGMYDIVNHEFYSNAGIGTDKFTKGDDV